MEIADDAFPGRLLIVRLPISDRLSAVSRIKVISSGSRGAMPSK